METFAVVVLIVILVGLTHLHNFIIRVGVENHSDDGMGAILITSFIMVFVYIFLLKYIIIWGANLI